MSRPTLDPPASIAIVSSSPAVPATGPALHSGDTQQYAVAHAETLPADVAAALAAPTVLVYSSDPAARARVLAAVGTRPDEALGSIAWVEVADGKACLAALDAGGIDVAVLDAESWPTGGMGISRQLRDEMVDPPATVLLVARPDDRWLAAWSRADRVLAHPIDPFVLTDAVVDLLKARAVAPVAIAPKVRKAFGIRVHEPE